MLTLPFIVSVNVKIIQSNQTTVLISQTIWAQLFEILEPIHVLLERQGCKFLLVLDALAEHIVYQSYRVQFQIPDAYAQLHIAEHKQRGRHFPLTAASFFLASTSVWTFSGYLHNKRNWFGKFKSA